MNYEKKESDYKMTSMLPVILVVVGLILAIGTFNVITYRKNMARANAKSEQFLSENPDAARIYVDSHGYYQGIVEIHSINGEEPVLYVEDNQTILCVVPGTVVIETSFIYEKKNLMSKKTTTVTVGPAQLEVTVEPNKMYTISGSRETESFSFVER